MIENLVSFIIPNRGGKDLDKVIQNINEVYSDMNKEIIIVEQCDNIPFMRGQLFNIGVNFAKGKYIALSDNDIYHLRKVPWIDIYENVKKPLIGFKYISQITLNNKKAIITKTSYVPKGLGAFNFMKKQDFINFNGFSNLFIGWGYEDNEYATRFEYIRIPQNLGHLTHPRRQNNNIKNTTLNLEFLNTNKNRNNLNDGYNQTKFNLIKKEIKNNVIYLYVNKISVIEDFKYKDLLEKHYAILENKEGI